MPERSTEATSFRPRATIVVEWENALHSESARSEAMLLALRRQTVEMAAKGGDRARPEDGLPPFELLVAFDPARFVRDDLEALLGRCLAGAETALIWRLVPVEASGYYGSKNHGAAAAAGEIVVFLDCDVVPESGWLEQLLAALEAPAVQVVAGNTYIEPAGLVGKAFALTWFFPLRSEDVAVRRARSLFANNLAVRRELFARHPFPEIAGTSRGACLAFAEQLDLAGVAIVQNPRARVSHPAPSGFAHVSKRALAQGRDYVLRERLKGRRFAASWPASAVRLLRHWAGSIWKISTGFHRVGLHPLQAPAAVAVAAYYYLLFWAGETMLQLGLRPIRRIRI
jgi:hypothetical protein